METRLTLSALLLILLPVFFGCQDYSELDPPSLDPGEITPDVYVAIGNSLTAGYQNNALYESSQHFSFPALIARQLGIDEFEQPLISDPGIGGRLKMTSIDPPMIDSDPEDAGIPLNINLNRPYNNLGIPGVLLMDVADQTDFQEKAEERGNIFFQLVLRNQALGASLLEQAGALSPSFITLWLGNNEILAYATSGGTNRQTIDAFPPPTFSFIYGNVAQNIAQTNANVVVVNVPDIQNIPFFTFIPPFVVDFDTNEPILVDGEPVLWDGVSSPNDLVLLTALEFLQQGYGLPPELGGTQGALPPSVVLSSSQVETVIDFTTRYNDAIATRAADFGFALLDINSAFADIHQNGYVVGSDTLTTDFVTGGLFSLDGVHPSSRGYAIIANLVIDLMNDQWNANIPNVPVGAIPGSIPIGSDGTAVTSEMIFNLDSDIYNGVDQIFK